MSQVKRTSSQLSGSAFINSPKHVTHNPQKLIFFEFCHKVIEQTGYLLTKITSI